MRERNRYYPGSLPRGDSRRQSAAAFFDGSTSDATLWHFDGHPAGPARAARRALPAQVENVLDLVKSLR